jgi:hypothetical protein
MTDRYTGWYRPWGGQAWLKVCEADEFDECWCRLLDLAKAGDKVVLESSRHPADTSTQLDLL